jgi:hypothetical protein
MRLLSPSLTELSWTDAWPIWKRTRTLEVRGRRFAAGWSGGEVSEPPKAINPISWPSLVMGYSDYPNVLLEFQ